MGDVRNDPLLEGVFAGPPALQAQEPKVDPGTTADPLLAGVFGAPGAGTPEDPFQGLVKFSKAVQDAREIGNAGFRESALGNSVAAGHMTLDQAEAQMAEDDALAIASGDLAAYEEANKGNWLTQSSIGVAKALPLLEETLKVGGIGAGLAGGGAALTGIGLPFAVPFGGAVGTAAMAGYTADFIKGQEYLRQRRKGIPHDEALMASSMSGNIQGMLTGIRFGQVAKLPLEVGVAAFKGQAGNVLKNHALATLQFLTEGAKFGAIQLGLSEAQTATRLMFEAIAGTVSKTPTAIPTVGEAVSEFIQTFQETLKTAPAFFVGGKTVGVGAGLTGRVVVNVLRKANQAHLAKQQAKLAEAPEELPSAVKPVPEEAAPTEPKGPSKRQLAAQERKAKRLAAEAEINRIITSVDAVFTIQNLKDRLKATVVIQSLLKRLVKNSDNLEPNLKERLLARIPDIDSMADLRRLGEKFLEDLRQGEFVAELKSATARLTRIINRGQPDGKKAKVPPELQASLTWYEEFFTPPKLPKKVEKFMPGEKEAAIKEAALKRATDALEADIDREVQQLGEQVDKLEKNELAEILNHPESLLEKRRIAQQAAQFWSDSLTPDEINTIAESLEAAFKEGRTEFLAKKMADAQRKLESRAEVIDGVQGTKPVVPSKSKTPAKQLTNLGRLINDIRRTGTSLWDKMLQDTPANERQGLIDSILDFTKEENKQFEIFDRSITKLHDLYVEAVGSFREAQRLIRNGLKEELFEEQYTDALGNTDTLGKHTIHELVYLHLASQDPSAIPGLIAGNKYTLKGMVDIDQVSTQETVARILSERADGKYLKLADALTGLYRWFAPLVGNHYLKEYGTELPLSEFYSGRLFHRGVEKLQDAPSLLEGVHDYARQFMSPTSTKLRKNSKLPVRAVDPFNQVVNHINEMSFWIANSEKARTLSFIFSDSSKDGLRDVISHKLSSEFMSMIDGRIAWQYHLKPGIMNIGTKAYQSLKNNMATGFLGLRLDQAPKQMTTIFAALTTSSFKEFASGLARASDPKKLNEYLSNSLIYRDRQNQLLPQILEATTDRTYLDAITKDRLLDLKAFALIPMSKWGDGVASAITGFIEFNRVREAGGTIEQAVLAGDRLVDRTASSSRPSQRVPAEFKRDIASLSLTFSKQMIQFLNLESGVIRDAFIHKDLEHVGRALKTVLALHAAQTLFEAINTIPSWVVGDEDDRRDATIRLAGTALLGAFARIPLVGFDVIAASLPLLGIKGKVREPKTIIGGLSSDSFRLVTRWGKLVQKQIDGEYTGPEEYMKAFKSLAGAASVVTGIPFWGLFSSLEFAGKIAEKAQEGGE